MGDMVISEEDGNLKLVQHYNLRFLLRRLLGHDELQRRPVVRWWNCMQNCEDDTFILKLLFVLILLGAFIRINYELFITNNTLATIPPGISLFYQLLGDGILLAIMFTTVFALQLLLQMKVRMTPLWRKEEIKSISGLVQHL